MAIEELQHGRYKRLRLLGSGGMGEVFLMEDTRISRQVAIKVIRSEIASSDLSGDQARLFEREARAIAALEHQNILPLYDFGEEIHEETTITYMVMPYCADGSLAGWLKQHNRGSKADPGNVTYFIEQAAEALQHAHEHHVIHLDVKPSNFLLRRNKKQLQRPALLLADFGIARSFTTISSSSHTIRGTPTAMAPEQWSGEPVPATDQYALAVMAYEMLAGRPPFTGGMEQLMYRHFSVAPEPPGKFNPHLSGEIDSVLLRALGKKPEERYPSITAFAAALGEAIQHMPSATDLDDYATLSVDPAAVESSMSQLVTVEPTPPSISRPADGNKEKPDNSKGLFAQEPSAPWNISVRADASAAQKATTPREPLILPDTGKQIEVPEPEARKRTTEKPADAPLVRGIARDPDHEVPTISATPAVQSTLEPRVLQPPAKRSPVLSLVNTILLIILLVVLVSGGTYFFLLHQGNFSQIQANTATAQIKSTLTPVVTPTPTPPPGLYIADTYNGSMTNQTTYTTQHISVHIVQSQGAGLLQGGVTLSSPSGVYPLNGTVNMQGNFSFTVEQPSGQQALFFTGQTIHQGGDTYLRGDYCSSNTKTCLTVTGYFTVGPGY